MKLDRESLQTVTNRFWVRIHHKKLLAVLSATAIAIGAMSCATVERTVLAPPQTPGASFIGSEGCSQCHEDISRDFKTATHARLKARGENAKEMGCESCHGPGSLHDQAGGGRGNIFNPRKSAEACFQCHVDKRGEVNLRHGHPLLDGKITCGDCHDPHKGSAIRGGGTALASEQDTCTRCHAAQKGPFVFEHEAVREGCTTCHSVHGSVNAKMLAQRNANLCLKCHMQSLSGTVTIGGVNHSGIPFNMNKGTCWTAGCHEAVHGSQVSAKLRF